MKKERSPLKLRSSALPPLLHPLQTSSDQRLPVPFELEDVPPEPGGPVTSSNSSVPPVSALPESAGLASGGGEAAHLAVLVDGGDDPVDARVVADFLVVGVDHDYLVVLHGGVLVDPVGVQDAHVGPLASGLLLGDGLEVALELELVDTLVLGLSEDGSAGVLPLAATTPDGGADDDVSLLGLVTEAVGLVGTGGPVAAGELVALAVLPGADAHEEAEHVTLLLPPDLLHVLVASHSYLVWLIWCCGAGGGGVRGGGWGRRVWGGGLGWWGRRFGGREEIITFVGELLGHERRLPI